MPKKHKATEALVDDDGMLAVVLADASAFGEDTLTDVYAITRMVERGHKIVSKGTVIAKAVAEPSEGETASALADTDVYIEGADKIKIKEKTISVQNDDGSAYEISITNYKAKDNLYKDGDVKLIVHEKHVDVTCWSTDIDGNVSKINFDAQAVGEDTLVTVDAYALAIEDELSISTIMITSEVG